MATANNHACATERLAKLASGFLGFGPDSAANINLLTRLCGETMGAGCALYNRLDNHLPLYAGEHEENDRRETR